MFCGKCGNQVADGAAFCPHCGAQLSAPQQTTGMGGNDYSTGYDNGAAGYGSDFGAGFASGSSNPNCTNGFKGIFGFWLDMWKKNYANAKTRATRKEYWSIVLINAIISGILGAIWNPLAVVWGLATIVPNICVYIRRCHDIGKKGTLIIFIYIAEVIGAILTGVGTALVVAYTAWYWGYYGGAGPIVCLIIGLVFMLFAVVLSLIIGFKGSKREDNQWGPYPFK